MKLLVFGRTGQVARELVRRAPSDVQITALGRESADFADPNACAVIVRETDADAVINAAAYTNVDKAETEEATAALVNADAPAAIAQAAAQRRLPFLHISTDYVFDGAGDMPFTLDHDTAPLGVYGRSKLKGEEGVRRAGGAHLILRTSWVVSAHGTNFVKTMLRLGAERETLNVVADQIGGPTPATAIADALFKVATKLMDGTPGGTHHFAGAPDISKADFARAIMSRAGLTCRIESIPSSAYPTAACRPLNSRLDCSGFEAKFGIPRPDWHSGLDDILSDLGVEI